jgi:hypothetical protein
MVVPCLMSADQRDEDQCAKHQSGIKIILQNKLFHPSSDFVWKIPNFSYTYPTVGLTS